jgi:hypothetical protein
MSRSLNSQHTDEENRRPKHKATNAGDDLKQLTSNTTEAISTSKENLGGVDGGAGTEVTAPLAAGD